MISVFDAMKDGVYITDRHYTIQYMNAAMIRDFGQGIGEKCHRFIARSEQICAECKSEGVFGGEAFHRELHMPWLNKSYDVMNLPLKKADGDILKLSVYRDITQEKQRTEKLKATERDYRRLFEHVGCGVYISSKEGKFLDANQALLHMFGYDSKEEFLNINILQDLYLRPEDRKRFQQEIETAGQVVEYEIEFKRRDGSPIPVLLTGHVRCDEQGNVIGYEGIIVDQTQRKRMEKEIREVNDFLNKIIHSSPNAVMAADMRGRMLIWNRAAEEILGYKTEEVIGRMNITEIYPQGMARKVMQMLRRPDHDRAGRLRSYPIVYMRRDGKIVEGNLSAAILYDDAGKELATVGIFVDLKERLDMERRLRQTQEQLLQAEKLSAMGRLTSQVAHELNNPLYGIMNTLELMKTEIQPGNRRRKILDMALSETVRLSELLRKMLTFSKPDQEIRQPTDINTILDEILLLHEKQFRENNIAIEPHYCPEPCVVFASKNQLRQVFLNMIANARDAMPGGGVLTVETGRNDKEIRVRITDTGMGIREENLPKIFDAFFTTKESVKGVGLGLSVCYGFIKDHGGDIQVQSAVDSGTTFTILLPSHPPAENEPTA
ncbi:MAG: PAS domain-containing sensor histidine kinase [Thermodesulfobacteriota bacterium]